MEADVARVRAVMCSGFSGHNQPGVPVPGRGAPSALHCVCLGIVLERAAVDVLVQGAYATGAAGGNVHQ